MNFPISLPEQFKIVDGSAGPVTTNGGVTGAYVTAKDALRVYLVLQFTQAVGHATAISFKKATAVAGTGVTTSATCRVWANEDTATNDTLVAQTAGTSYTLTNNIKKKQVVVEFDPAAQGDTYDCLGYSIADSSQATNFVSAQWFLQTRYAQATPPTAVVD